MKLRIKLFNKMVVFGLMAALWFVVSDAKSVLAEGYGLTVAPMYQNLIIDKNDSIKSSFRVSNPISSTQDTYYSIDVEPFYMNDDGGIVHEAENDRNEIIKWISFDVPTEGKLSPNEVKEISFTITTPDSAPAGGQYVSILVTASDKPINDDKSSSEAGAGDYGATIKETKRMSHLIYAEIAGSTIKRGEIYDVKLPSLLLSGDITGSAFIKNTGNVHGDAKSTLQVYPLFSSEEIYSNEENPEMRTVLPDRSLYAETKWDKTPALGIFNVVYTVEFGETKQQVSKMVIKCPLWLLFILLFAIFAIVIFFVVRFKKRNSGRAEA